MEFLLPSFLLLVGLVLIIKGGDWFVDAASWMAEVSGIPKLIVGATIVSIATTLPEMFVSTFAAIDARAVSDVNMVDMAIGNAMGSVTANISLIFAIALICMPTVIKRRDYALKIGLMLGAAALIVAFGYLDEGIGVLASILLLVILAVFIWDNVREAIRSMRATKADGVEEARPVVNRKSVIINVLKFVGGAAGIVLGAKLLVDNGQTIAQLLGVPERIISVTILAVGTSLPELVTTVTSIVKKQSSLSAGNILGANILDMTMILPVCGLIWGDKLPVTRTVGLVDLPAALIVGAVAFLPTLFTKKFSRWQGILLLVLYVTYLLMTTVILA